MFPLIKFKICRILMNCNSCSLFSASRAAILGSQPNSLIIRKMPIAIKMIVSARTAHTWCRDLLSVAACTRASV